MTDRTRVVMINEVSYVAMELGSELSKRGYSVRYIGSGTGFLDKTIKPVLSVARIKKDEITHAHYAMQRAWIVAKLSHLDVLHVHGSDIRRAANGGWGWMVKSSLRSAKKVVFATPDLEEPVKKYREDAVYLPTPVDTERFRYQKPENRNPVQALYVKKMFDTIPSELRLLLERSGIRLTELQQKVPYNLLHTVLPQYDIFIEQTAFRNLSKTALESMSCGVPTIDFRHASDFESRVKALSDYEGRVKEGILARQYVETHHAKSVSADILLKVYEEL